MRVYPRVCGGTDANGITIRTLKGLSPRVRGNQTPTKLLHKHIGSIPACAGEPPMGSTYEESSKVYPRVCGGTGISTLLGHVNEGLSPRVRGNRGIRERGLPRTGSIPACAGEP